MPIIVDNIYRSHLHPRPVHPVLPLRELLVMLHPHKLLVAQRTFVAEHCPLLQTGEVIDVLARNQRVIQSLDSLETDGTGGKLVQQLVHLEGTGLQTALLPLDVLLIVA